MSIKLYLHGTPNGTDGVEVQTLTIKNVFSYMGLKGYPGSPPQGCAVLPIYIREESGFVATNVVISSPCGYVSKGMTSWPTGDIMVSGKQTISKLEQNNIMIVLFLNISANIVANTPLLSISYVEDPV